MRKIDKAAFLQALHAELWPAAKGEEGIGDVGVCAEDTRELISRVYDSAMPRASPRPRRAAY